MPYKNRIHKLKENLIQLNEHIKTSIAENVDQVILDKYNRQQYDLNQEITRLTRLQWEEDTQRVDYDDDR